MLKILSDARFEESVTYRRSYEYADQPGAGFAFDCDSKGNVDVSKLGPCAVLNWEACQAGMVRGTPVHFVEVLECRNSYRVPAVGRCDCGLRVELYAYTNTCECGTDYDSSGQALAPRSQWGEETGEAWYEVG